MRETGMKMGGALLAIMASICLPAVAMAAEGECGGDGERIVRAAYPGARPGAGGKWVVEGRTVTPPAQGDPHAVICRRWRGVPGVLLVAVPLIGEATADANMGDLDLLVMDQAGLTVRHRLRIAGAMDDDAIAITRLAFDTAGYRLTPDRPAFGLRKSMQNGSQPNPFDRTELSLYEVRGGKLVNVLDRLVVVEGGGEWDTRCAGTFERVERTLAMVPGTGVADIQLGEARTVTVATPGEGDRCEDVKKRSVRSMRLRFDGTRYPVSKN